MARTDLRDIEAREGLRESPEKRLTRRRHSGSDKFSIPARFLNDPDVSYEWKRTAIVGMPDHEHQIDLRENHWQPVMAADMPGMMPSGYEGAVERAGMVLMRRPRYLTEEATEENLDIARRQVQHNERKLGITDHGTLPRTKPTLSREIGPVSASDRKSVASRVALPE